MAKNPKTPASKTPAVPMTLKRFRYIKGFETATAFCEAADVTNPTISGMEKGNDEYIAAREAVCAALNISMKQLFILIDVSREVRRREEAEQHGFEYP